MILIIICLLFGSAIGGIAFYAFRYLEKAYQLSSTSKFDKVSLILLNGILALLVSIFIDLEIAMFFYCILIGIMSILILFDQKYMLLPTRVIYIGSLVAIVFRACTSIYLNKVEVLFNGLLGAVVGVGLFLFVFYLSKWLFKKEGLGFGDVRLMFLLGMIVGLDGLFLMLIIACILAAVVGSILILVKRKSEAFPFGPFLCGSTIIWMIFQDQLMNFYFNCLGL